MIRLYVGFDPREAAVYHVFTQSVIDKTSVPVSITPLHQKSLEFDGQQDGSNAFIYSRYLVPWLQDFKGWAVFCDGDMIVREDLKRLWDLRDPRYAAQVVKHDYLTRHPKKYIGTPIESQNVDYPRKNWSSVILWNCAHPANRILSKEYVSEAGGAVLHRFQFLNDNDIGELPPDWNHLVGEKGTSPRAKLVHWTLGAPGFEHYQLDEFHEEWNTHLLSALHMAGEQAEDTVRRAIWRHRQVA